MVGLALLGGGCNDRSAPGPGDDGGTDLGGSDVMVTGWCEALTEVMCEQQSPRCVWGRLCDVCGSQVQPSCLNRNTMPVCPDLPCPSCQGLDEGACEAQPGCRADYCQGCSCTPTYIGCSETVSPGPECPALGCEPNCDCGVLDEASCRAAGARCTVAECPSCSGGTDFVACIDANESFACPGAPCETGCRDSQECNSSLSEFCVPPGTRTACGICNMPDQTCGQDADCQAVDPTTICEVNTANCGCVPECLPGCQSDAECGPGLSCQDARCQPADCSDDVDCPASFECSSSGGSGQRCQPLDCDGDGDCGGGFCVEGACYDRLGECRGPVP